MTKTIFYIIGLDDERHWFNIEPEIDPVLKTRDHFPSDYEKATIFRSLEEAKSEIIFAKVCLQRDNEHLLSDEEIKELQSMMKIYELEMTVDYKLKGEAL